jgi:hypothetical protein
MFRASGNDDETPIAIQEILTSPRVDHSANNLLPSDGAVSRKIFLGEVSAHYFLKSCGRFVIYNRNTLAVG